MRVVYLYLLSLAYPQPMMTQNLQCFAVRTLRAELAQEQAECVKELLEQTSSDVDKFCKAFKCSTVDQMQVQYLERAMAALRSKIK
jgi:hypothetical protein